MRIEIEDAADIDEGAVVCRKIAGQRVLLTRVEGEIKAVENRCPHLGLGMDRGTVEDGVITCPWHGSRFDIASGENQDWVNSVAGLTIPVWSRRLVAMGREPAPLKTYRTHTEGGAVFIEIEEASQDGR